jgi:superfamily II DNA/RNA helicase
MRGAALIVAPDSTVADQWYREIEKFTRNLHVHLCIVSKVKTQ